MPEPEIARRCPTCGASIREVALFCPQCGDGLQQKSAQSKTSVAVAAEGVGSKTTTPRNDPKNDSKHDSKHDSPTSSRSLTDTVAIPKPDEAAKAAADESGKAGSAARVRGPVGTKIQRATTLARDVEGDVLHRARKVREISCVVLDEDGDDTSLRFVLVAVGLLFCL